MKASLLASLVGATLLGAAHANATPQSPPDLLDMKLEDLTQVTVTSVGKKAQRLDQTAAAVFVINAEDIRRSGATSLPEVLRLAPGVHVAQIDANKWSVSVRGLGGRWAGQLLVLMDGRTLYSPLYGGVYWDVQDTLLEDIERIEVIRGPGGTLWGANAVNGVINIITRSAADTQGGLAYVRGGSHESEAAARYGTSLGDGIHLRAYAKRTDHDPFLQTGRPAYQNGQPLGTAGHDAHDDWGMRRAGFRLDNALASGELQLQAYLDQAERRAAVLHERIDTRDIEFQQRFSLGARQEIVWGAGYRGVSFAFDDSHTVSFRHARHDSALYNIFVQDEIRLHPDVALTLGGKFEHNAYTGVEPQPNARLFWQIDEHQGVWGAWSRAVRMPSRAELDFTLRLTNVAPYTAIAFQGNPDLAAARLTAHELGWRRQLRRDLNVEATIFRYDYDDFFSLEPLPGFPFSTTSEFRNLMGIRSQGYELSGAWQVNPDWRLRSSYARLSIDARPRPGSADAYSPAQIEGSGPRHQFQLHSNSRLRHDLDFDAMLYRVGRVATGDIDAYMRLDLRLAWKPRRDLELSLVGRNLLDKRHFEFLGQDSVASDVPRSVLAQLRWHF